MAFIDSSELAALSPAALNDAELMALQGSLASARRALESASALVAAEVDRRSHRDLGYSGLAAQRGLRSGAELVQKLSGSSLSEARKLVRIGTVVTSAATDEPWLRPALGLSVGSLDALRNGLGAPSSAVSSDDLARAAGTLAALP